jgi:hypothetical protein
VLCVYIVWRLCECVGVSLKSVNGSILGQFLCFFEWVVREVEPSEG